MRMEYNQAQSGILYVLFVWWFLVLEIQEEYYIISILQVD